MSSVSSKLYCADRRWWTEGGLLTVALSGFLSVGACILPVLWSCCQQKLCHLFMHINTCNIKHLVVLVILTKNIQGDYTYQEFSWFHWLAIKNNLWKIKSIKINNCVQLPVQVSLWLMKNILYQNKPLLKKFHFLFWCKIRLHQTHHEINYMIENFSPVKLHQTKKNTLFDESACDDIWWRDLIRWSWW